MRRAAHRAHATDRFARDQWHFDSFCGALTATERQAVGRLLPYDAPRVLQRTGLPSLINT